MSDPPISSPEQLGGLDLVPIFSYLRPPVEDFIRWLHRVSTDDDLVDIIRADLGLESITPGTRPELTAAQKKRVEEIIQSGLDRNQKLEDLSDEEREKAKLEAQDKLIEEAATAEAFAELTLQVIELYEIIQVFSAAVDDDSASVSDAIWMFAGPFSTGFLEARVPAAHGLLQLLGVVTGEHHEVIDAIDFTGLVSPFDVLDEGEDPEEIESVADQRTQRIAQFVIAAVSVLDAKFQPDEGEGEDKFVAFSGWDPEPDDDPKSVEIASRAVTFTVPLDLGLGVTAPLVTVVALKSDEGGPGVLVSVSAGWSFSVGPAFTISVDVNGAASLVIGPDGCDALGGAEFLLTAEGGSDPATGRGVLLGSPDRSRLQLGHYDWRAGVSADAGRWFANARLRDAKIVIDLADGNAFLRALAGKRFELDFDVEFVVDNIDGPRLRGGSGATVRLPLRRTISGFFVLQYVELRVKFDDLEVEFAAGVTLDFSIFRLSLDRVGFTYSADIGEKGPAELGALLPPSGIGLEIDAGWISGGGSLFFDLDRGEYSGVLELSIGTWGINAIGMVTTKRPDGTDGSSFLLMLFLDFEIPLFFNIYLTGFGGVFAHDHQLDTDALGSGLRTGALDDLLFPEHPVANAPRLLARYRQLFPIEEGTRVFGLAVELSFGKPAVATLRVAVMAEWGDRGGGEGMEWLLAGVLHAELPRKELGGRPYLQLIVDVIGVLEPSQGRAVIRGGVRDSFVGTKTGQRVTLAGEFFLARWRDDPDAADVWIGSFGGWHPDFRQLPQQVPTDLERFRVGFKLGPVSMSVTLYFAFTPETYQFGVDIQLKAKLGPARLEGRLSIDAIIERESGQFTALVLFKASIKIWGKGLSVEIKGMLAGPSLWVFQGTAKISILWKSFEIDIDEEAGSLPGVVDEVVDAIGEVVFALSSPDNRRPNLPGGRLSMATLAESDSTGPDRAGSDSESGGALAHPLGTLSIDQVLLPFGTRIERVGERRLPSGPTTLRVESATIGDMAPRPPDPTFGEFAIGQFTEMTNEERLARTAFDRLPNGVKVGSTDFVVPSTFRDVEVEHETRRVGEEPDPHDPHDHLWTVFSSARATFAFERAELAHSATGRSSRARSAALVAAAEPATTSEPALVAVSTVDLRPAASLLASNPSSPTLAAAALAGATNLLIIPEFEVAEGVAP